MVIPCLLLIVISGKWNKIVGAMFKTSTRLGIKKLGGMLLWEICDEKRGTSLW